MPEAIAIIPARYASSRFPGKPLVTILGKSMIQRTWENTCCASSLSRVLIATDDHRIADHAQSFGADVVMTPVECLNGTERLLATIKARPDIAHASIFVNVQGDEPALDPTVIDRLISTLRDHRHVGLATPTAPLRTEEEWRSTSIVKAVADVHGRALIFTRAPIGHSFASTQGPSACVRRHVGVYAFRRDLLHLYGEWPSTPLQLAESIEPLKILENGHHIHLMPVEEISHGVDAPEDVGVLEAILRRRLPAHQTL